MSPFELPLTQAISTRAEELLTLLSSQDDASNAIHNLVMAVLSDSPSVQAEYKWPGYYFMAFANVQPSGRIKDVHDIRGILSELKWPLRASAFWEIIQIRQKEPERDPEE
jgi:hypothetical protein